jgi:hypothetical protein
MGAQTPGQNINMVTGTQWPDGDPFLEAQNEPSIAVSSRNSQHLLAGANDWRTRDIPGLLNLTDERGDVWDGVFKSYDGGLTWRSTLLPGFPLDSSTEGLASPLKGFVAAADPTVRPGTNGMFYYSGIVFNRGSNALGKIFVARFIDNNNRETGDAIQYISAAAVDNGTAGQFLDKPWLAVDIPRSGAQTCLIPAKTDASGKVLTPAQSFLGGVAYIAFADFTGSGRNASSKIKLSRSLDCGATWSNPIKLSESNAKNQGTTIAIDPGGAVYVAWRRSAAGNDKDAILIAKSTNQGQTFTKAIEVATFDPGVLFDQDRTTTSFRAKAFPTLAVDGAGRVYLAWSQRGYGPPLHPTAARIVVAHSTDGVTWLAANRVLADPNPNPGHQLMPAMAIAGKTIGMVYYDNRDDHTIGIFTPTGGGQYSETRQPVGNLPGQPGLVFTDFISDANLGTGASNLRRRHTIDVRVAQATWNPGAAPVFNAWARVSQYVFGSRPGPEGVSRPIEQLQVNAPNFPMFVQGQYPFFGDYIDLATQMFVSTAGGWAFNIGSNDAPVFHATWADNRDVRPPPPGVPWSAFTPVGSTSTAPSLFCSGGVSDCPAGTVRPACAVGQAGIRNENVYTSRITQGMLVGSPGNVKTLGAALRAFTVTVQNTKNECRSYRLTIVTPLPAGVTASFLQTGAAQLVTHVTAPPRSTVARTIYVTGPGTKANIKVKVEELNITGCSLSPGALAGAGTTGLEGSATVNPDVANPDVLNPDVLNPDVLNPDVATAETYNPDVLNPDVLNPDVLNPEVLNPDVLNPDVANPDVLNPDVLNPDVYNPDVANPDVANPDVANPDVANPDVANPDVVNPDVLNPDVATPDGFVDFSRRTKNTGNTAGSFSPKVITKGTLPPPCAPGCAATNSCLKGCLKYQLIIRKTYSTPIARSCTLGTLTQNIILANIVSPQFISAATAATNPDVLNPDVANPDVANPSMAIAPGDTTTVTLRTIGASPQTSQKASTATLLTSSANPSTFLQPVTFTATVTSPGTAPTGTVTFKDGADTLGTAAVNGSGRASFIAFALTVGAHSITAEYGGDANNNGSTSAALNQTVNPGSPLTEDNGGLLLSGIDPAAAEAAPLAGAFNPTGSLVPVTGSQVNTGVPSLSVTILTTELPDGSQGVAYGPQAIQVVGGTPAYFWCLPQANPCPSSGAYSLGNGLTLNANGTVTGTPAGVGTFTFDVKVSDSRQGPSGPNPDSTTGALSIRIKDGTPPVIVPTVTPTPNGNGWNNTDVTVTWSVTDPESPVVSSFGCGSSHLTTETTGTTLTCSAANADGLVNSVPVTVKIDKTAPLVAGSRAPAANLYGWNNTDVTVSFTCNASISGVATGPVTPQIVSSEGVNQSRSATCTDMAGNTGSATVSGINMDKTAPNPPTAVVSPTANAAGWHQAGPVWVNFGSSGDAGPVQSGVEVCSSAVSVPDAQTDGTPAAGTCTDKAGNTSAPTVVTVTIDKTNPTPSLTTPVNGSTYVLGSVVNAAYSCTDTNSGIVTCSGTAANGAAIDTASVGSKSFVVTATDLAGRTASVTHNYTVVYNFIGTSFPDGGYWGDRNQGAAVPLRWQLANAAGSFISDLASMTKMTSTFTGAPNPDNTCSANVGTDETVLYLPATGATGGSDFRFSPSTNEFLFNWDSTTGTPRGLGCYTVEITLNDGTKHRTGVRIR